jgi:hypothetical protein
MTIEINVLFIAVEVITLCDGIGHVLHIYKCRKRNVDREKGMDINVQGQIVQIVTLDWNVSQNKSGNNACVYHSLEWNN